METLRLSGPLWCGLCADLPRQLLLNFNERARDEER
jgi:hypothetical protein